MAYLQQTNRFFIALVATITAIFLTGCSIMEDYSDCFDEEFLLYIKVIDVVTGKDITTTGTMENITLYIFDPDEYFVKAYDITASQILNKEPIRIKEFSEKGGTISAWGNIGEQMNKMKPGEGTRPDELMMSVKQNPTEPGYDLRPNDFFFGLKKINPDKNRAAEIILTQKNAKLQVTVRGLYQTNREDYYFRIINKHNGYNYLGIPSQKISEVKEKGIFNNKFEYISPKPLILIHSIDPSRSSDENSVRINLYQEQAGGDTEIISTNKDMDGNYITLTSGKTTNVLIELKENGQMTVFIQVTPWDEIYQWSDY